jgi:hypothetical protein
MNSVSYYSCFVKPLKLTSTRMIGERSRTTWALLIVEGVLSGTYKAIRFRSTSLFYINTTYINIKLLIIEIKKIGNFGVPEIVILSVGIFIK